LASLQIGDLILVQADQVEEALEFIQQYIAANAAAAGSPSGQSSASGSPITAGSDVNGQAAGAGNGGEPYHHPVTAIAEKSIQT
jgi:hypothetical protein